MWIRVNGRPVDTDWKERNSQIKDLERKKIMEEWITVWRLKDERNWTDSAIKKYLGNPVSQNGYKVYSRKLVVVAEHREDFRLWMVKRLDKQFNANVEAFGQEYAENMRREILILLDIKN